jgi:hypothetical protein
MEQLIQKRTDFNLPTYVLFIDYEKAFERVPQRFTDRTVKTVQSLIRAY